MFEVERTNIFIIEGKPALRELADNCARLWNELNFERRQAYTFTIRSSPGTPSTYMRNTLQS
ncbi:MAG: hypothetical protein QXT67_07655 [Candidatus Bathyarchaeia archaeon]